MAAAALARRPPPDDAVIVWEPKSKPQAALIACPVFEVFFGGARGSLKTDGVLGDWISHSDLYGEHAIGLMVRRNRVQLMETYERAKQIFTLLGFKFNDSEHTCRAPNGARLRFAYLERDSDAEEYQGHSYTRVYVEEIGNFPSPSPVMKLMATLRSAAGVPCGFRATGNPGGPGQHWVKARYIDPAPGGWEIIKTEFENPWTHEKITRDRVFIPGKITDHDLLGAAYIANLQMSGSPELVRAWLEGDWNVVSGAFFPEFSTERHVVKPFAIPEHWSRIRAMDWGSARPFSVGWYAVSDGTVEGIARGCLVKYREWYGMREGQPNVGVKMTAEEVGAGIVAREDRSDKNAQHQGEKIRALPQVRPAHEPREKILDAVLDPAAFTADGGPSIAERMANAGAGFRPADNRRVARSGAMGGWDQLRARLKGNEDGPLIVFFSTCVNTIRTIPGLQHDELKPEDLDTEGEDHAADETRYACMSRPILHDAPEKPDPKFPIHRTFNELVEARKRKRLQLEEA